MLLNKKLEISSFAKDSSSCLVGNQGWSPHPVHVVDKRVDRSYKICFMLRTWGINQPHFGALSLESSINLG